ncbi:MAG: hypothetical protein U9N49_05500 [Campylobacterota bacterium]|nr:hypothetical protein [Campylobacterota bacterium]
MIKKKMLGAILASMMLTTGLFGFSKIDQLIKKNDIATLKTLIDATKIVDNENLIPREVKEHALIIIDNEYEVKSLFEFHDGQWNDKVNKTISKLLENEHGTTYGNLFNYKVNAKEFNPYESDNFKYSSTTNETSKLTQIVVKILDANNTESAINKRLQKFLKQEGMGANAIISVQFLQMDQNPCKIILSYQK